MSTQDDVRRIGIDRAKNEDLKKLYDTVYAKGEDSFFTIPTADISRAVVEEDDWKGKRVLEVGCGTGYTASQIALKGAESVLAIDYSQEAIKLAKEKYSAENLRYECKSYEDLKDAEFDVLVIQETLEHTNDPFTTLKELKELVKPGGKIIATCPSFLNIRGYIWMSLLILFKVPMSLSDLHYLCPFDMQEFAEKLNLSLKWRTIRHSQGNGELMVVDMEKRLTNALRDAGMDNSKVPELIEWLEKASKYDNDLKHTGSTGVYSFTKNN